ncbi:hypothetical protein CAPTEDRAFT_219435 [Capitella teleta]|uniref:Large ribosomal subunit protein uL29m n=1 Tax=Capitella teleta TaxID=283909 RepID=R7V9Z7_CAPTE|nr:hypothetical protein CAPTEDRAFT_219435 [Capitella teleta]|eukprot:ELU15648.1 hypothetical protein CAPTEDRAFT_219435 [Capitella teleta]
MSSFPPPPPTIRVIQTHDQQRSLHTTASRHGLNEFFDEKDNWGKAEVKTGRPWRCDELRLKSNTDLHKLWYVLLKERNMVMTMQAEYKRQCEVFPSPERIEKLEESMENVLEVIKERDRAVNLLETGETGEPGQRWAYNQLGLGYWHQCREHYVPQHYNKVLNARVALSGKWQYRYKRLYREKLMNQEYGKIKKRLMYEKRLKEAFPELEQNQ